jgi:GntR family transcriptional regulator
MDSIWILYGYFFSGFFISYPKAYLDPFVQTSRNSIQADNWHEYRLTYFVSQKPSPPAKLIPVALNQPWCNLVLDNSSSEPYYSQLRRQIQHLLGSGQAQVGTGLPSERDLAAALGLSRTTIKRCYDQLRKDQLLGGRGRGGSVIKADIRVQPTLGQLKGFTQEMTELGKTPSSQIISRQIIQDRALASLFARSSSASFLKIIRVRSADEVPMTREVAWYDLTSAGALSDWDGMNSAYQYIKERCKIQLQQAEQTVEAVLSSPEENDAFGFDQAQPCLLFKRKSFSSEQQLIEYVEGTFRGDAYVYKLTLSG